MLRRLVFQDPLGIASSTGPPARRGAGWAGGLGAQSWKFSGVELPVTQPKPHSSGALLTRRQAPRGRCVMSE